MAAKQRQLTALRDVLAHGLRELAIRVAQVDLSDDTPTEDEVRAFVTSVSDAAAKAAASGSVVPENVAVYVDPRLLAAAVDVTKHALRVQYGEGQSVLLAPPPAGYQLGSIAIEIDKAAQEATPTEPPKYQLPNFTSGMPAHDPACTCRECTHGFNLASDPTVEGPRAP